MEPKYVSPLKSQTLSLEDLTAFEHITSFNLFLFSRTSDNQPIFLLHQSNGSKTFSHWSGIQDKYDPNIYFAIIREFISQNRGLLYTPNLTDFLAESADPSVLTDLVFETDLNGPVRPQSGFTKPMDDICRRLSETPYIFQDQQGCVTYFLEFPLLSLEAINKVSKKKKLDTIMGYYTFEEILDARNKDVSRQLSTCFKNAKLKAYTEKFIRDSEPILITARYAIISCEPSMETYMMQGLHYPIYKKHGEHWSFYRAYKGQFPTDAEIKTFKGVIIPGSSCSAYDGDYWPWFSQLFEVIEKIVNGDRQINLLGICFGAQIIAQALGGQVKRMNNPFIKGGDQLNLKSSFYKLNYIKNSGVKSTWKLLIAESHGDHIVKLPTGAVLQGSSAKTDVECYTIGDKVLAFQGHPEYNEAWTAKAYCGRDADNYIKEKFPSPITREHITNICYTFLKKDSNYSGV